MKCIMFAVRGGTIQENGMQWANCQMWQIGFKQAFDMGVMNAKADYNLVQKFEKMTFPAVVDAEFIQTKGKDKNGREIAVAMLAHMEYLQALAVEDLQSLLKKPLPVGQPIEVPTPAAVTPSAASADSTPSAPADEPKRAGGIFGGR